MKKKKLLTAYDVTQITERLWIGAMPASKKCFETIKSHGITHIIDSMRERNIKVYSDRENIEGLSILWNPTEDNRQDGDLEIKPLFWVKNAVEFAMDALSRPGNSVLCHCAAGINRGPSLGYAVLRCLGYSADDAENLIREARPVVQLAYKQDVEQRLEEMGWTKSLKTVILERYKNLSERYPID